MKSNKSDNPITIHM